MSKPKLLTAANKKKLANEIMDFLKENDINEDVCIYYSHERLNGDGTILENVVASDYFDYANDKTISMSFEGSFYEVINYYCGGFGESMLEKFNKILKKYGLYYELGNAWNLSTHYLNNDLEMLGYAPVLEGEKKNPIFILKYKGNCPPAIEPIRAEWEKRENEYGDVGSCVIGAGFEFKYEGLYYEMPPQGHWQGSVSWEASVNDIQKLLTEVGCEEIYFNYGRMD